MVRSVGGRGRVWCGDVVPSQFHTTGPNNPDLCAPRDGVHVDAVGLDVDSILR